MDTLHLSCELHAGDRYLASDKYHQINNESRQRTKYKIKHLSSHNIKQSCLHDLYSKHRDDFIDDMTKVCHLIVMKASVTVVCVRISDNTVDTDFPNARLQSEEIRQAQPHSPVIEGQCNVYCTNNIHTQEGVSLHLENR